MPFNKRGSIDNELWERINELYSQFVESNSIQVGPV